MKNFITTFIGIVIAVACSAQTATVTWGELSKKETEFENLINCDNGEMIKYSYDVKKAFLGGKETRTPILTKYDSKFNEIKSNEFKVDEKGVRLNGLLKIKNYIYLLTNTYDKEEKSTTYFASPINIKTLEVEGGITNFGKFMAAKKNDESIVSFIQSVDSSKLLVFATTPYKKSENEKYYMSVYDSDMKKLWSKIVELPYLDKYVEFFNYFVTNQGEVGVLLKHYDQDVTKESIKVDGVRVASYKTKLLIYKPTTEKPSELVLNLSDKFISNLNVCSNSNNKISLFGMYKEKEKGNLTGYFISTIDPLTNQVSLAKQIPFPTELIEQVDKDNQGSNSRKDPGLSPFFTFREVLQSDNGNLDYIIEYYMKEKITYTTANGGSASRTIYEFGDIIDINVAPNGNTIFTRVPKLQRSFDYFALSGYMSLSYKSKLYLFYNDDRDNIKRDLSKKPNRSIPFEGSSFVMAEINAKGELTRQEVYSNKDVDGVTYSQYCRRITKNKISLYNQKSGFLSARKDMLGYLEIK